MPAEPYELRTDDPSCPRCGYNLRGTVSLSGARCPECGARLPFHRLRFPGDWRPRLRRPARAALRAGPRLLVMSAIAAPLWMLLRLMHAGPARATAAVLVGAVISLAYRGLPPAWRWHQLLAVPAAILVIAFADWREALVVLWIAAVLTVAGAWTRARRRA